jgi:hypothetical protein
MANRNRDAGREAAWRRLLAKHGQSGLSVRAFCRPEKLSEPSFYAWRRTIAERDGKRGRPTKASPAFLPAVMTSEPRRETAITIDLAGGRMLRLPESMSAERLAELVQALEARAAR